MNLFYMKTRINDYLKNRVESYLVIAIHYAFKDNSKIGRKNGTVKQK